LRERDEALAAGSRRSELDYVLRVLRARRFVILFCTLLVGGSALAFSLTQQTEYTATAGLLFRDAELDQKLFGSTALPPSTDPTREAATNVNLVDLQAVSQLTATALGGGATAASIQSKVSASAEGQSNIVLIKATDPDPAVAARIANTYAQQFIAFRRNADRAKVTGAQQLVQSQLSQLQREGNAGSPTGVSLQNYAEQLGILASLQPGTPSWSSQR
jgi:uncharacterized protein involved in exopolysaccharide biosynthesis